MFSIISKCSEPCENIGNFFTDAVQSFTFGAYGLEPSKDFMINITQKLKQIKLGTRSSYQPKIYEEKQKII